ncbi:Uma2 family endonuclease, partial [Candidatus Saccharibacteria bacterium]|nr:Uma2 family endonuclease [Candidatus Saccharibacteria bacterium]NIV99671.1 Uma2 family endonuclease [Candidatus Saccharibacteria bacterium]NIW79073.1 Uma2 family endonuclease [Calditrichia bacterium]
MKSEQYFMPRLMSFYPPHNVFQPNILFISNDNMEILTEKNVQGAPDLIVEILSPATAVYDLGTK